MEQWFLGRPLLKDVRNLTSWHPHSSTKKLLGFMLLTQPTKQTFLVRGDMEGYFVNLTKRTTVISMPKDFVEKLWIHNSLENVAWMSLLECFAFSTIEWASECKALSAHQRLILLKIEVIFSWDIVVVWHSTMAYFYCMKMLWFEKVPKNDCTQMLNIANILHGMKA